MIRALLLTVLSTISIGLSFGQQVGDYRSRQGGIWFDPATWEVFYNGAWRQLDSSAAGPHQNVIPIHNTAGVISIRHNVVSNGNIHANQIVVEDGAVLTVQASRTLLVRGDGISSPLQVSSSGHLINHGTLDMQTNIGTIPVEIWGTFSSTGTILTVDPSVLIFHPLSTYIHQNETGGNIPLATWDINSTCRITGLTRASAAAPKNLGQSFGQFEFQALNGGYSPGFHLGGGLQDVRGNLTIKSTGSDILRLGSGGSGFNLNIGGDLIIQGGTTILAQSLSGAANITVGGDLIISGGTLRLGNAMNNAVNLLLKGNFVKTGGTFIRGTGTGSGAVRFNGALQTYTNNSTISDQVHFSVQNGSTLDLGTEALTGAGSFTLFAGGTLIVGSTDPGGAIQLGTSGGNIRLSGNRTYHAGSLIVYNGAAAQYMGNGHPPLPNTNITNSADDVTLVANVAINGILTLGNNNLIIGNHTLTLGGELDRIDGALGAGSGSSVIINGTGDFGDLVFLFTDSPYNPINNLTINRAGGTVYLGSSLIVAGAFNLANGNFSLGQFTSFTLTLRGNFAQSGTATLSVYDNSSLVIEGAGTLPSNVRITGPNLFELTMNRPSSTFNSTSPLTLTKLNLFNGTVNNSALNIVMADEGLVTRRSGGSITSVLGVIKDDEGNGSFDVLYDVEGDITTGNELPYTDEAGITRLRNLRKIGPATVNLNHPIQVNGDFDIEEGAFHLGSGNNVAITGNLTAIGQLLTTQSRLSFIGSSPQLIDAAEKLELYDLEVNQSAGSTVTLSPTTLIDISTRLAVLSTGSTFQAGNNQLTLLSTPQGTANVAPVATGAAINGSVIVQRYLPKAVQRAEYYHLASPVTNATFSEWSNDVSIKRVDQWNEATAKYAKVSLSSPIVNGKGYVVDILTVPDATIELDGTLRTGAVNVPVTTQTPGVVTGDYGWNLIGNPYPSAIDWDNVAIDDSQVYDAIYMWDNFGNSGQGTGIGIGVSYVDGIGTPAGYGGQIAQGQAFWVKALQNTSIPFTESAKISATTTTVFREKEIPNVLRIALNGNGVKDEAVVRLRDGATENFDGRYDAYKFMPSGFNISTLTWDNVKAAINAFGPSSCNSNIPLIADGAKTGSFTLDFSGLESFDPSISLTLVDLVAKNRVDIRSQQSYAFTITDENLELTEKRFELSIGSNLAQINTAILAQGETLCEDEEYARITLDASEPGVEYTAELNGTKLSDPVVGTGSAIELLVRSSALTNGENKVTVMASAGTCSMAPLAAQPVITRFAKGRITDVTPGEICGSGSTTLKAAGASAEGWYAWYESADALEPIEGQSNGIFTTPNLSKTKTYYVSAVNALGCEGVRVPVKAIVSFPEQVNLTTDADGNLVSSVAEGIKWYYNGALLENETSAILAPAKSGVYTVEVANGGCKTTAEMEVTGLEEAGIVIYPNPTANKVWIRMRTSNKNVSATLVNAQGLEIEKKELLGNGDIKETELDLLNFAPGMYHVRIHDGRRVINRKIAKVD